VPIGTVGMNADNGLTFLGSGLFLQAPGTDHIFAGSTLRRKSCTLRSNG
jgi:hypothetical protein